MFVLLARDRAAPASILEWVRLRINLSEDITAESSMLDEAQACANTMRTWREANEGKWRVPTPPLPIFSAPLRWEGERLYAGKLYAGRVARAPFSDEKCLWRLSDWKCWNSAPTLSAAQSALVAAVMEMQGE
jgi:hypothetical protein